MRFVSVESFPRVRRSEGAIALKYIMRRFGCMLTSEYRMRMEPFRGEGERPYNATEQRWYQHVCHMTDDLATATLHLKKYTNVNAAFGSRAEFLRCMAAFVAVYKDEVLRHTHKGVTIIEHIIHLCTWQQVEWLFNFSRFKAMASASTLTFLPTGTTANEAIGHQSFHNLAPS